VNSCDGYQQFAVKCVELARRMDSPRDRSAMLEMALIWSRLAEYAAKTAARKDSGFVSRANSPLPAALVCRGVCDLLATLEQIFQFFHSDALTVVVVGNNDLHRIISARGGVMRVYRVAMGLAVVGLTMSLGYSTSHAQVLPSLNCAVGVNVHPGAWILLNRHPIARCTSNGGCKCVSCYNLNGSVSAACYPLIAPIPFASR
jgi:hypothetical protein